MNLKYFVLSMACVMAVTLAGCSASQDIDGTASTQPTNNVSSSGDTLPSAGVGGGAQNSAGVGSGSRPSADVGGVRESGPIGDGYGQNNASGASQNPSGAGDVIDDIGDAAGDLARGAGNVARDAGNAVGNAANNIGGTMR